MKIKACNISLQAMVRPGFIKPYYMNGDFLKIIAGFAEPGTRLEAAGELAKLSQAECIFCFLFDPVVNAFLPAPGFSQSAENINEWQRFLAASQNQSCFTG